MVHDDNTRNCKCLFCADNSGFPPPPTVSGDLVLLFSVLYPTLSQRQKCLDSNAANKPGGENLDSEMLVLTGGAEKTQRLFGGKYIQCPFMGHMGRTEGEETAAAD